MQHAGLRARALPGSASQWGGRASGSESCGHGRELYHGSGWILAAVAESQSVCKPRC
jgi:hypothetical protein